MQLSIAHCRLGVFQDIYYEKSMSVYVEEYSGTIDRRPNPNAAESVSNTSGLSFPSFRYRSGWNSMGSLKFLGLCNIDLSKKIRRKQASAFVLMLTMHYPSELSL